MAPLVGGYAAGQCTCGHCPVHGTVYSSASDVDRFAEIFRLWERDIKLRYHAEETIRRFEQAAPDKDTPVSARQGCCAGRWPRCTGSGGTHIDTISKLNGKLAWAKADRQKTERDYEMKLAAMQLRLDHLKKKHGKKSDKCIDLENIPGRYENRNTPGPTEYNKKRKELQDKAAAMEGNPVPENPKIGPPAGHAGHHHGYQGWCGTNLGSARTAI